MANLTHIAGKVDPPKTGILLINVKIKYYIYIYLVGGLECFFPIIYGMSSFPLTFIFFKLANTTNQLLLFIMCFPALPLFGWFNHQPLISIEGSLQKEDNILQPDLAMGRMWR